MLDRKPTTFMKDVELLLLLLSAISSSSVRGRVWGPTAMDLVVFLP